MILIYIPRQNYTMTSKQAQKSKRGEFSLFLDKKLVADFDKVIYPYKRSNKIHELISNYLEKMEGSNPQLNSKKTFQPKKGTSD